MNARSVEPAVDVVDVNGVFIAYDAVGDEAAEPLVLIAGLGSQLVNWPLDFCRRLAAQGFYVIRFDNRDAGLSSRFPDGGYSVGDMAGDVAGLIRSLGFESAHVVGQSLGGLIAQALVSRHPDQMRSLALLSTTPALSFFLPAGVMRVSSPGPAPQNRAEAMEAFADLESFFASSAYPADGTFSRELAGTMWDRGWYPAGREHQLAAILGAGDMTAALRTVRVPTLVVHGTSDPLISPRAAEALAATIPDAQLQLIANMGHQLPAPLWNEVSALISTNARRAAHAKEDHRSIC